LSFSSVHYLRQGIERCFIELLAQWNIEPDVPASGRGYHAIDVVEHLFAAAQCGVALGCLILHCCSPSCSSLFTRKQKVVHNDCRRDCS
jgi:hypothetical protein